MQIDLIIRRVMIKYPLFGSIIANLEFISDCSYKTAATDGKHVFYNPDFLGALTSSEQVFLVAYEVSHVAFNHLNRKNDRDVEVWNIATDGVINANLKNDGLTIIKGVVDIPLAINYDAEELYDMLLEEKQKIGEKEFKEKYGEVDNHSLWKEVTKNIIEKSANDTMNEKGISEKEVFKLNKQIYKQQLNDFQNNLTSKSLGQDVDSDKRIVKSIGTASALLNWNRILQENIKYDYDWSFENAYIEDGVVTPSLEAQPFSETEIVLDTSGSINEDLLRNFLIECKNILGSSKLKVGCFDTKFYGFHNINNEEDIGNMEFRGGGGTDFNVAVRAFSANVLNKIIFTDGDADMPDLEMHIIWIVFGNERINPKGGRVIYVDKELLNSRKK